MSVETDKCGRGITSLKGAQVACHIEVKVRVGNGDVTLSKSRWIKAQRFGKDCWLYVVTDCKTEVKLRMIQDPPSRLRPKDPVKIVRYMGELADWKGAELAA